MNINFHDLHTQYLEQKNEIHHAIQTILDSGKFIMGEEVYEFEQALKQFLGCAHVMSCGNGTDALLLALMALDLKPNDEIITTPFSFIAAAEVIVFLGAKPIFVDIENDTYNIDAHLIESKITSKTRAIIPVALYGQPSDMKLINSTAEYFSHKFQKKIYVIEDAAQSLGATYQDKKSGNLADMSCLSFFPTKPLGCYGDGGAISLNDDVLAEKIKCLRVHGQTKRYHHKYVGINSRLDTLQAAILKIKLQYFKNDILRRQSIAKNYNDNLKTYPLTLPYVKPDRTSVFAQYSIQVKNRNHVLQYLNAKNIPTAVHYPKPLHLQECFEFLNYQKGDFPIAEHVAENILSLPISPGLKDEQQEYIYQTFEEIFSQKSFNRAG